MHVEQAILIERHFNLQYRHSWTIVLHEHTPSIFASLGQTFDLLPCALDYLQLFQIESQ